MQIMTPQEAAGLVRSGDVVAICGTGAVLDVSVVLEALGQRFAETKEPANLTIAHPAIPGFWPNRGGLACLDHKGMVECFIGGSFHPERSPGLNDLILEGAVAAYNLPMGVMYKLFQAIGNRQPGVITKVGIGTFVDPREKGGRLNEVTPAGLVQELVLEGERYLFYKAFPVNVAIIRGTAVDELGNLTLSHEPAKLGMLEIALAAKASGGKVIAQVSHVVRKDSLDPRLVEVPARLVDAVVVNQEQSQYEGGPFEPALYGGLQSVRRPGPIPNGPERVVAHRAARELRPGDMVNLGVGIATWIPNALAEAGRLDEVTLTIEHGQYGGVPGSSFGLPFPMSMSPQALLDGADMFSLYHGGMLDIAFLSFAQVDRLGNVNVAKFGTKIMGVGGFIDICQNAKTVVFCGTLTTGGLRTSAEAGRLTIHHEGKVKKFLDAVELVCFNGQDALRNGQRALYMTERAVFELTEAGVTLREIAPGVTVEQVVSACQFRPVVPDDVRQMDPALFTS